jgi:hypothetical protein
VQAQTKGKREVSKLKLNIFIATIGTMATLHRQVRGTTAKANARPFQHSLIAPTRYNQPHQQRCLVAAAATSTRAASSSGEVHQDTTAAHHMFMQGSTAMIRTRQRSDAYTHRSRCLMPFLSAVVQADAAASVAQRVVSAAAAVALLLAPPALAFGPVSVKLDEIVVNRVECAGGWL